MVEREVTTPVVVLEVPGDGVESRRPGRRHRVSCAVGGSGRAPRRAAPWVRLPWVVVSGFEGSLALHPIPGREPADPGLGQAVGACCFGRGQALRGDGGDDQPGSRPHRRFAGPEVLPMSRDMCCSCPEPAHCPRYNCDASGISDTRTRCLSARGAGEPDGCVLAPGIGVVQQLTRLDRDPFAGPCPTTRSQWCQDQVGDLSGGGMPAHDPLGEHVDDEGDVDEPAQILQ
jgi:hypothetical protein